MVFTAGEILVSSVDTCDVICLGNYVSVNKLTLVLHHSLFGPHVTVLALKSHGIPGAVMTR